MRYTEKAQLFNPGGIWRRVNAGPEDSVHGPPRRGLEREWFGDWCHLRQSAFDGRWDVRYGDTGWECDPGTFSASTSEAIDDVQTAIKELQLILAILKKETPS